MATGNGVPNFQLQLASTGIAGDRLVPHGDCGFGGDE